MSRTIILFFFHFSVTPLVLVLGMFIFASQSWLTQVLLDGMVSTVNPDWEAKINIPGRSTKRVTLKWKKNKLSMDFLRSLVTFGDKNMKILRNLCKARWSRQKKQKENHATKLTKIPQTKRRKYEMKKIKVTKSQVAPRFL